MATNPALQRTIPQLLEEKVAVIHPVKFENLAENVNKMFETVAKRAYQIFESNGRTFGHETDDWFKAEMELLHPAPVEMNESGEQLEVRAEVPGFNEKELKISVEPRRLTISGKRESSREEEKKGKKVYAEFCSNRILRVMDLPTAVDADKVTATLKNGILELTMPKAAKGKTIEIKAKAA
jgi:HSP20 family protein